MQNDIIVKKPPVSAQAGISARAPETQIKEEPAVDPEQEARMVDTAIPGNSAPVGIIAAAIFICLCLVFAAVYSTLNQA